jgi:hypothetical protein
MTAVEWLYKNLLENPISNQDIEYNEAVFHNAKEMEKQQGYSEEEVNKMFDTLKINSVDNVATIHNVDLFISSWKQEFKNK